MSVMASVGTLSVGLVMEEEYAKVESWMLVEEEKVKMMGPEWKRSYLL